MDLDRGIDSDDTKQAIMRHLVALLRDLDIEVICEGVETAVELEVLRELGVGLIQGYLLAAPKFEAFAQPAGVADPETASIPDRRKTGG